MTLPLTPGQTRCITAYAEEFIADLPQEFAADQNLLLLLHENGVDTSGEEPIPTYRFHLVHRETRAVMGGINLRVGQSDNLVLYRGHIGYHVAPDYRGNRYAERACRLLLPLAAQHRLDPLWITCNPDNLASRRTCENLGAVLVEILAVPQDTEAYRAGARTKCRYRLDLTPASQADTAQDATLSPL